MKLWDRIIKKKQVVKVKTPCEYKEAYGETYDFETEEMLGGGHHFCGKHE
jgi:hypothetical protein